MSGLWDENLFKEYLANRGEIYGKKINTDRAVKSQRKKCVEWHNMGFNINAILQHAIDVGWRGLFIPAGMEPRQAHVRPAPELEDLFSMAARDHRMPRGKSEQEKQRKANQVRAAGSHAVEMEKLKKLTGAE